MSFLFRVINKRRWDWTPGQPSWLPIGDVPAAPFADLAASPDSSLSMWLIEADRSNLDRVATVLAAGRQHLDKLDCALIDEGRLLEVGFPVEANADPCVDQDASDRWHRDLVRLTSSHLQALVRLIYEYGEKKRFLRPEIEALLRQGLSAGHLNPAKLHANLRQSLTGAPSEKQ